MNFSTSFPLIFTSTIVDRLALTTAHHRFALCLHDGKITFGYRTLRFPFRAMTLPMSLFPFLDNTEIIHHGTISSKLQKILLSYCVKDTKAIFTPSDI